MAHGSNSASPGAGMSCGGPDAVFVVQESGLVHHGGSHAGAPHVDDEKVHRRSSGFTRRITLGGGTRPQRLARSVSSRTGSASMRAPDSSQPDTVGMLEESAE